MSRRRGGLIGKKVIPSGTGATDSASGIWNLNDVVDNESADIYPQPDVPPNVAGVDSDVTLEVAEGGQSVTAVFSGASDVDGDTVFDYQIIETSGLISVNPTSRANTANASFTFSSVGNVSADTDVDFTVRVTDQYGLYTDKTFTITVLDNVAPVADNITSNPSTIEFAQSSTNNVTFTGASDSEDGTTLDWSVSIVDTTYITGVSAVGDVTDVSSATFAFTTGNAGGSDRTNQRFNVTVTDSVGATATKQFTMDVQSATELTISSNVNNYNIASAVTGASGSLNNNVNLTINSGVTVGSSTSLTASMLTGTGWGSGTTITITNNGSIVGSAGSSSTGSGGGHGGNGGTGGAEGNGSSGSAGSTGSGSANSSSNGGDAFEHSQTANNNLSVVFATQGTRTGGAASYTTFLGGGGGGGGATGSGAGVGSG